MTINKNEYSISPCKTASIPYWKAKSITIPHGMSIVHQEDFKKIEYDIVNIALHFFLKDVRHMQPPVMNRSIAVS